MKELIIGQDGFIGRRLCQHLPDAIKTTRRYDLLPPSPSPIIYCDLTDPVSIAALPNVDIVYICAGINGTLTCAQNPHLSYKTNVDGTIAIADRYAQKGIPLTYGYTPSGFVVWIGSTTVQWLNEHYGRQKRITEQYLRALPHVGIVRAGRVLQSNVDELCKLLIDVGRNRRRGIHPWAEDESPYSH